MFPLSRLGMNNFWDILLVGGTELKLASPMIVEKSIKIFSKCRSNRDLKSSQKRVKPTFKSLEASTLAQLQFCKETRIFSICRFENWLTFLHGWGGGYEMVDEMDVNVMKYSLMSDKRVLETRSLGYDH